MLARIEEILRERSGRKNLVLSDYFDYIGRHQHGRDHRELPGDGHDGRGRNQVLYCRTEARCSAAPGILKRFWYKFGDDNLSNQLKDDLW